jgi:sRNA-binding regulator protein Hfq
MPAPNIHAHVTRDTVERKLMAEATKIVEIPVPPQVTHVAAGRKPAPGTPQDAVWNEPRKLVRPRLPDHLSNVAAAPRRLRGSAPLVAHAGHTLGGRRSVDAAGPSEAFYFQKQMQAQTQMVFVLEDGERVHGVIEWYDRETIKIRNSTRTLIFKRAIKYLYKDGDL